MAQTSAAACQLGPDVLGAAGPSRPEFPPGGRFPDARAISPRPCAEQPRPVLRDAEASHTICRGCPKLVDTFALGVVRLGVLRASFVEQALVRDRLEWGLFGVLGGDAPSGVGIRRGASGANRSEEAELGGVRQTDPGPPDRIPEREATILVKHRALRDYVRPEFRTIPAPYFGPAIPHLGKAAHRADIPEIVKLWVVVQSIACCACARACRTLEADVPSGERRGDHLGAGASASLRVGKGAACRLSRGAERRRPRCWSSPRDSPLT